MTKRIVSFLLILLFMTNNSFAAGYSTYYCEKTFRVVNVGDSMDTIKTACGEPSSTSNQEQIITTSVPVIKWIYSLGMFTIKGVVFNLPTINITFRDQNVIEITRNGLSVNNGYCAINGLVTLNDTMDKVIVNCGQPSFTTTAQQEIPTTKIITQWVYNFGPYLPQIIFAFDNNKVIQISSGQLGK